MNRIMLVTGAAGGIGRAAAGLFFDEGWRVIGVDRRKADVRGVDQFIVADVSDPRACRHIVERIQSRVGRLDALVNNAAVMVAKELIATEPEEWDDLMATNVRSVYLMTRETYPLLCVSGGAVVNVASVHAAATSAGVAAYAASKGAVTALTRASAVELASDGIRVNAILPGAVDTLMLKAGVEARAGGGDIDERLSELAEKHPVGRVGDPDEVAQGILFLADSDRSGFVTGQSLIVDGGVLARLSSE